LSTPGTAKFRFIDLFAGIGGFHHALAQLGGECVLAADLDAQCRKVYKATWPNHPDEALIGDIRSLTRNPDQSERKPAAIDELVPDHEVLCAGFPCQPFSKSGMQMGLLDQIRGTLFFDIMKIAEAKKPRYIIMENVRNLAGPRHSETFDAIIASLRSFGYRVDSKPIIFSPHLLSPNAGGSPQHRERVFILAEHVGSSVLDGHLDVGIRREPSPGWDPNSWTLDSILQPDKDINNIDDYRLTPADRAALDAWQTFVQKIPDNDLPGFPLWADFFRDRPRYPTAAPEWKRDFIRKNSDFYKKHKIFIDAWRERSWMPGQDFRISHFIASRRKFEWQARRIQPSRKDRDLWKLAIHFRPSGIRVKAPNYLPTLVAITQTPFIGPRKRYLTPIEAGRLQGFPDDVFPNATIGDKHAYKQAGNAVHVGVVKHIASMLFESTDAPWLTKRSETRLSSSR
jgi:DNA (cytosine-5)-methyltransferase 1